MGWGRVSHGPKGWGWGKKVFLVMQNKVGMGQDKTMQGDLGLRWGVLLMLPASWSLRCGSHCGRFRRLYHKNNDWRFYFLLNVLTKSNENLNSLCLFGSNLISKFSNAFLTSFFHIGIYLTTS